MSSLSISPEVSTHLLEQWEKVREFSAQVCHVQAPIGSGSKHVLNHFQRQVAGECLTWHIRFREIYMVGSNCRYWPTDCGKPFVIPPIWLRWFVNPWIWIWETKD